MSTYIHFTEEQKQWANEIDLVNFLEAHGEKLLKSGREKRLDSDRSITIRGNRWYDHSNGEGGLAIDFVQYFYQISFPDAVTFLLEDGYGETYKRAEENKQEDKKPFVLPNKNINMRRVFAYLIKKRYIDGDIISFFSKEKLIYESCELSKDKTKEYHNAVFVGFDENKVPRHGHKQGLYSIGKPFKGNIDSSDTCYSFNYIGKSNRLYVFEAPIDMLSFITIYQKDWHSHSYISLCGLSEQAMLKMLEVNPHIDHVILCLDHDKAGIEANEKFYDILNYKKIRCSKLMPEYKDWNEDLKASLNLPAIPAEEHPHYPLRDKICLEIYNLISQLKEKDISLQELNKLFQKTKTSNMEQIVETLKQLSAFSLLSAKKEYKQLGTSQDINLVKNRFYHGFKAYENRSRLNNRLDMIGQEILKINGSEGIISKDEKLNIAKAYEAIGQHSLKAIILIELQEQKQEQRQDQNQIKEMIM